MSGGGLSGKGNTTCKVVAITVDVSLQPVQCPNYLRRGWDNRGSIPTHYNSRENPDSHEPNTMVAGSLPVIGLGTGIKLKSA